MCDLGEINFKKVFLVWGQKVGGGKSKYRTSHESDYSARSEGLSGCILGIDGIGRIGGFAFCLKVR